MIHVIIPDFYFYKRKFYSLASGAKKAFSDVGFPHEMA